MKTSGAVNELLFLISYQSYFLMWRVSTINFHDFGVHLRKLCIEKYLKSIDARK